MDLTLPHPLDQELAEFRSFLQVEVAPNLSGWNRAGKIPEDFFRQMGRGGWFGFRLHSGAIEKHSALREALIAETLAALSPGLAIAVLAHMDLGFMALYRFGSEELKKRYAPAAVAGQSILCLGNTENIAGSDVAGIAAGARKVDGGWRLSGTKAFVTNGAVARTAVITAVTDPQEARNRRLSMFLVDLEGPGVKRTPLNKRVWIPSDLTRIELADAYVPDSHLLGERGHGLPQVLEIFSRSRVPISALTLGTAEGAFEKAVTHARRRRIFGKRLVDFQAKAFEIADLAARIEAVRLMVFKASLAADGGGEYREEAAMAKYLSVELARRVTLWASDLFGAASVILEHPIHKYPMDAWGSALGEGTQDVQKLIIFREVMKRFA